VSFLLVYIAEAHPGSIVSVPTEKGTMELEVIPPTSTMEERMTNMREMVGLLGFTLPVVVDDEENSVKNLYAGWPDRLYVIGVDGKIKFKSAPGPMGYKVPDLAAWLQANVP
jgi:hypothetical protein